MSGSQRRGKGKATTGKRKRGEASVSIIDLMHDASSREKAFTPQEKADQLLPATNPVKEFYCNYFKTSLDAVNLRGKQILVTEEAIEEVLKLLPKTDQTDGYQKAEEDMRFMKFDWDAVKARIALDLSVPWIMGQNTTMPKGIKWIYLNDEARLWHQIFSNYIMPSTHKTEIPAAMITLLWCVMEDKDLYLPRFIRHYMARVHVRGTLPFPYLVTQLGRRADVPWEDADERPPAAECKKLIPHSRNFLALGYRPSFLTATADDTAIPSTGPSSSTAAPSTPTSEPVYHLVHRLFRRLDQMERRNKRRYEHVKLMIRSATSPPSLTHLLRHLRRRRMRPRQRPIPRERRSRLTPSRQHPSRSRL
ncbi:uncharacterized protein DS421_15g504600 [Arachis hypogaea]|nr:uncharacterized protein DS421_15g504600 [Arachis hypogaea]